MREIAVKIFRSNQYNEEKVTVTYGDVMDAETFDLDGKHSHGGLMPNFLGGIRQLSESEKSNIMEAVMRCAVSGAPETITFEVVAKRSTTKEWMSPDGKTLTEEMNSEDSIY